MKRGLLLSGVGLALVYVGLSTGCGGKVFVDPPGGAGGSGGSGGGAGPSTGTGAASTGTVTSTSSGPQPVCSCDEFCNVLNACGAPGGQCQQICNQTAPESVQCVCAAGSCNQLPECFGVGSGGAGGGTGGGPPLPPQCTNCASDASEGACEGAVDACANSGACLAILECHDDCGWGPQCMMQCDGGPGAGAFHAMMSCVVCDQCFQPCKNSPLINYCVDGL